jgi:hypothetical protein
MVLNRRHRDLPSRKKEDFDGSTGMNGLPPANTCNVQRVLRFCRYCQCQICLYAILLQKMMCALFEVTPGSIQSWIHRRGLAPGKPCFERLSLFMAIIPVVRKAVRAPTHTQGDNLFF